MNIEDNGFINHNNIQFIEINKEGATAKAIITKDSLNPYGIVHGGLIFALGDTVMGIHARTTGRNGITLDANINFLKPGKGKYLIAKSKIIKSGKTTCVLSADIYDDKDNLIAIMTSTYYYIEVAWK